MSWLVGHSLAFLVMLALFWLLHWSAEYLISQGRPHQGLRRMKIANGIGVLGICIAIVALIAEVSE